MNELIYREPLKCEEEESNYYVGKKRANLKMQNKTDEIISYLIDEEIEGGKVVQSGAWNDFINQNGLIKKDALLYLTAPIYYIHFNKLCDEFFRGEDSDLRVQWKSKLFVVNN